MSREEIVVRKDGKRRIIEVVRPGGAVLRIVGDVAKGGSGIDRQVQAAKRLAGERIEKGAPPGHERW